MIKIIRKYYNTLDSRIIIFLSNFDKDKQPMLEMFIYVGKHDKGASRSMCSRYHRAIEASITGPWAWYANAWVIFGRFTKRSNCRAALQDILEQPQLHMRAPIDIWFTVTISCGAEYNVVLHNYMLWCPIPAPQTKETRAPSELQPKIDGQSFALSNLLPAQSEASFVLYK